MNISEWWKKHEVFVMSLVLTTCIVLVTYVIQKEGLKTILLRIWNGSG